MDERFANSGRFLRARDPRIRVLSVFNPWLQFNPAFLLSSAAFHAHLGGSILPETGVKNAVFVDYYS
jgi:hypothetical protein